MCRDCPSWCSSLTMRPVSMQSTWQWPWQDRIWTACMSCMLAPTREAPQMHRSSWRAAPKAWAPMSTQKSWSGAVRPFLFPPPLPLSLPSSLPLTPGILHTCVGSKDRCFWMYVYSFAQQLWQIVVACDASCARAFQAS